MQFSLSQRAHLPTAVPGLEKAPVQNLIFRISQQNPKSSSIHYPESNSRVLFINVRNSTFKGAGLWNLCWQLCHYTNFTKLPSSRELWPTIENSDKARQAMSCSGNWIFWLWKSSSYHIPALQQLSLGEESTFLSGQFKYLHPHPTYVHTDSLEICNTGWLGRTKTMTGQSIPWYNS